MSSFSLLYLHKDFSSSPPSIYSLPLLLLVSLLPPPLPPLSLLFPTLPSSPWPLSPTSHCSHHLFPFLTLHFTLPYSTPSLEPPSQTAMMMATFSLVSQRRNPHSAVASSSLLMSFLCLPGHWGGGALYSTKTTPSLAQRAENCSSHTGGVGR